MRDHELTQTTRPAARVRRVAVIRTDGHRFHVHPTTRLTGEPNAVFTTPTLDLNDFADGGGQALARSPTYPQAQQAIDRLAAASFPVQYSEIIGRDPRLVDRLTGRMTQARASATGAVTGAWFGLLIGLVVGLLTFGAAWLGLLFGGLLVGALCGGVRLSGHGKRPARPRVTGHAGASRHRVMVADGQADHARQLHHLS